MEKDAAAALVERLEAFLKMRFDLPMAEEEYDEYWGAVRGAQARLTAQAAEIEALKAIDLARAKQHGDALSEVEALRKQVVVLREGLRKIAKYGEDHGGYVNAQIDGKSVSRFSRDILAVWET